MHRVIVVAVVVLSAFIQQADSTIIVAWDGTVYAHPVSTSPVEVIKLGPMQNDGILPSEQETYSLDASPLRQASPDGFGFYHGVWSPDRNQFVYVEMLPPQFRVRMLDTDGTDTILMAGTVNDLRGYLDPVAWTPDGTVIFLERHTLNHLTSIAVWTLDPTAQSFSKQLTSPIQRISGQTMLFPDRVNVFLGFDVERGLGFLLDTVQLQVQMISSPLDELVEPPHGFDYSPVQVLGVVTADELEILKHQFEENRVSGAANVASPPDPFLHWMLPDAFRRVTCYPDSEFTQRTQNLTCPLLSRNYEGHEGTDISGQPDGLPLSTPVYPAAAGWVLDSYRGCTGQNPSCNSAYGNTITLEHAQVVDGQIQVWYTGYGHLRTVLAENQTYVSDLTGPLALSGATGTGGAHLHFEVRNRAGWIDPWDDSNGAGLWLMENAQPTALVRSINAERVPPVLWVCTAYAGNNIRSGAGIDFEEVGETAAGVTYHVIETAYVSSGTAQGTWYHVIFEGGAGWLWSGLLVCN